MYIVQTRAGKVKSMHFTLLGARAGVDKVLKADSTGLSVFISKVDPSPMYALITVACFALIGILLAWRG